MRTVNCGILGVIYFKGSYSFSFYSSWCYFFLLTIFFLSVIGFPMLGDPNLKEESPFSPSRIKYCYHSNMHIHVRLLIYI